MKSLLIPFAFCLASLGLYSGCTQCTSCSFSYDLGGGLGDSTVVFETECGSKSEVDAYLAAAEVAAAQKGTTATCVKE